MKTWACFSSWRLGGWALLTSILAVPGVFASDNIEQEPIRYSATQPKNAITRLSERIEAGKAQLTFDSTMGYLPSLLRELGIGDSSQMLVFSKTSFQRHRIGPHSPRALFFNDEVYVGYCRAGDVLEVSAVDPQLGTVFYTVNQDAGEKPRFVRQGDTCLVCHSNSQTHGFPGNVVRSVVTDAEGYPVLSAGTYRIDQTSPLERRWGGWYVTGTHGKQTHLGNLIVRTKQVTYPIDNAAGQNLVDLDKRVNLTSYPSKHSDLVALMVLEHQTEAQNLLTQASYQVRIALYTEAALNREVKQPESHRWASTTARIKSAGDALVKYLLFCKEAPLSAKIAGTTKFAEEFAARGPRDAKGRSLRDFDLEKRLFKYPCSYLIYSEAFDALPDPVKDYALELLWDVLRGRESGNDFNHLSTEDRRAIREILVATKPNLPAYWRDNK
jgi:hypothetical protein